MVARNETIRLILSTDFVGDITGGDSFSDIYGVQRFVQNYICKSLVLLLGRPYILLPQTYGPFSRKWSRVLAARIIRKSQKIYSRDREGLTVVKDLLGGKEPSNLKFVPDVAFVMDKTCPARMDIAYLDSIIRRERPVIGFNVSGLLYHGGYTKNNMFGLQVDYRALMTCIIEYLLKNTKAIILFVPHVFAPPGHVESDTYACTQLLEQFQSHYPERLTMARGPYSHTEIKYIIGFSDFFAGSRMHACIGAMSQTIPAAGLAYSRKFEGVFNSVGVDDCVVNLCRLSTDEALQQFCRIYEMRLGVKERLQSIIPEVQKKILNLFAD